MRRFSAVRVAAVISVLACVLALIPAFPASATSYRNSNPHSYLALGDSVTFGYNPLLLTKPGVTPSDFVGYPELASGLFRPKLKVVNASCPGETSSSLITGSLPDNGCQAFRAAIGLHVSYKGSQLKYAETYVAAHRRIKFVSLMIGANDLFRLQGACTTSSPQNVNGCIIAGLPDLLHTLGQNLNTTYSGLRAAGYKGPFVAVTYYSTDYRDPIVTGAIASVDGVLAGVTRAYGGKVADGFGSFYRAAARSKGDTCAAGLLIHLTPGSCDVHPSPAGAALLASALFAAVSPDRAAIEHHTTRSALTR
jgi:lysophospholipase L1-like esterase